MVVAVVCGNLFTVVVLFQRHTEEKTPKKHTKTRTTVAAPEKRTRFINFDLHLDTYTKELQDAYALMTIMMMIFFCRQVQVDTTTYNHKPYIHAVGVGDGFV